MERTITEFHLDDEGHWVAHLSCGHARHVRHNPPSQTRPWVLSPEGRAAHLHTPISCGLCKRLEMPTGFVPFKKTQEFNEDTIPLEMRTGHETPPATWARIHVTQGRLGYRILEPLNRNFLLDAANPGTVAPESPHYVTPMGPVCFYVEFFRAPGL